MGKKLIVGENDFETWCKNNNKVNLLNEWDYQKNGSLLPKEILCGSGRKVWWILHYTDPKSNKTFELSWQDTLSHRKAGRGCPYISSPIQRVLVGFNDLSTTHPQIAKDWALVENEKIGITITDVTHGSTKCVFWNCKTHGLYKAIIHSRVDGNNCPYCSGKQVKTGFNDLATTNPELISEWDPDKNTISPCEITRGSEQKVWWKCSKGHSWRVSVNSRTSGETGCPVCSGKKVLAGFNDLATIHPGIAKEWNYDRNDLTPEQVTPGSNKNVWWICKYGHEYQSLVSTRTLQNTGCPICNKERKTSFPEKAIYYYVKKFFPDAQENKKFKWLGNFELDIFILSLNVGIEYDGAYWHGNMDRDIKKDNLCKTHGINLIRLRTEKCPRYESDSVKIYYSNSGAQSLNDAIVNLFQYLIKEYHLHKTIDRNIIDVDRDYSIIMEEYISREKETNLAKNRPDLAEEWDYDKNGKVKPEFVSLFSNKKFWWICPTCHQSYKMMVSDRTGNKHSNCPICSGKRVVKGINDLATTNPELIPEWDFEQNAISPYEITSGTHRKVWWKCPKGHSWMTNVYVRAKMKCGCPICNHQIVDPESKNSFADLYPELLEEWDYEKNTRDPFIILPSSNLIFWWKCKKCGHEWQTSIDHRTRRNSGCPLCAHQVLIKGVNDLETQFPEVAKEWNYEKNILKPSEVSGGTNKKYWWKCQVCGYEWECVVASRTKRNSKCPICRKKKKEFC